MRKPRRRDSSYWSKRLLVEHPLVHAKLISGEIGSVRAACIKAGFILPSTRLGALKREWQKASPDERREFMSWIDGIGPPAISATRLADSEGLLKHSVVRQLRELMELKRLRSGDIMTRLGYERLDGRLGMAIQRRWQPSSEFLDRLAAFLRSAPST
jgi:hypothetical protein